MANQSDTITPSNPHSPRSTSCNSQRFAWEGMPSTSLYDGMTLRAPASLMTTSIGVEKHVPQRALPVGRGADVRPRLWLAVPGHMLECGQHMGRPDRRVGPLEAAHR